MRYLLDTHTFLWMDNNPAQLSPAAALLIQDSANALWLSIASVWEMQIKVQLGKLKLPLPLPTMIERQHQTNRVDLLPIALPHIVGLSDLPAHHKDPFDRMIVSQAITEGMRVISGDSQIARYPVEVVW